MWWHEFSTAYQTCGIPRLWVDGNVNTKIDFNLPTPFIKGIFALCKLKQKKVTKNKK